MKVAPAARLGLVQRVGEVLEFFLGLGAVLGGAALMLTAAGGAVLELPLRLLELGPFRSFVRPGVQLFAILIGVVALMVGVLRLERTPIAPLLAVFVGSAVVAWIVVEMVVLSGASSLVWASSLVLGTSIVALGVSRFRAVRSSVTRSGT